MSQEEQCSWQVSAVLSPTDYQPLWTVVRVLQVAAEKRRKAATKPFTLADSAVAAVESSPSATQSASATEDGSATGNSSGAAERGQQEHARTGKADGMTQESSHDSSPPIPGKQQLDHPEADTEEQNRIQKTQSVPPALESHNKGDEGNKDQDCNGFHDSVNEKPLQQDDVNQAKSMDHQQLAKGTKEAAASQAAAQERQQRLVQSLIEGCDELANDHQQVCMFSDAQQQAV